MKTRTRELPQRQHDMTTYEQAHSLLQWRVAEGSKSQREHGRRCRIAHHAKPLQERPPVTRSQPSAIQSLTRSQLRNQALPDGFAVIESMGITKGLVREGAALDWRLAGESDPEVQRDEKSPASVGRER
ncbi:MAG TPA: hypothetical protein VLC49_03170, partial [Solirubrobacteraceae bacterium]|nr:hypothetical protein [Solirubrobacteraceae bacterium]